MERAPTLESVRRDALALSQDDRELLAIDLHYSMKKDPGYDEAWAAEIARRVKEVEDGTAELFDATRPMRSCSVTMTIRKKPFVQGCLAGRTAGTRLVSA
jgi:hypothetical protein